MFEPSMKAAVERATRKGFNTKQPITKKKNYLKLLRARNVSKSKLSEYFQGLADFVALPNLLATVICIIAFGFVLGVATSCNGFWGLPGVFSECRETIKEEERIPLSFNGEDESQGASTNRSKVRIISTIIDGGYFNGDLFKGWIFLSAFILAFSRWQVGNRQTAMSEMFERKQKSNLLILDNKDDVRDLISGAVDIYTEAGREKRESEFDQRRSICLLEKFWTHNQHRNQESEVAGEEENELAKQQESEFVRQMFVYIELDNLEFAHIKYVSGLLDSEQMYRACEIFESRCQSTLFRHIAAKQGLAYYTEAFHDLICALLIFGYAASDENYRA